MFPGTGLLQISSAEENAFIIDYSPSVWKDNLNVWLGMSYDDKGKTWPLIMIYPQWNTDEVNFTGLYVEGKPESCKKDYKA